jgi:hypothetical protein
MAAPSQNSDPNSKRPRRLPSTPCSARDWTPAKGQRFELDRIEGGHVFAWQVVPSVRSQYLLCVICRKPHHVIFPPNTES